MTENLNSEEMKAYEKEQRKEEMQKQMISFALMILFTLIAFAIVASGTLSKMVVIPVLMVMCLIQVGFQFYYFMHMKEKGHGVPAALIYGGVWAALLTLAALGVISWW
ncbi:MAG TPA: cytochrome c oxidase subunit IVB [Bacillota bacterium]|nr:cytochrome c oxidase subunit IVB [Bacillota bacterium]